MAERPHDADSPRTPRRPDRYDAIVVGAGVAGLAFALRLPPGWQVALLTKGVLGESNTRYAQGGLAAAVGHDDDPALHEADTLAAGAGLCDPAAVRRLVEGAPAAVAWLVGLGARFDVGKDGTPLLGREAAHSRRRVLHAGGDATGAEIERALVAAVRGAPGIDVFAGAFARDLIVTAGRCAGVVARLAPNEPAAPLHARVTVLAAGGAGRLWATTSNPAGATADALGMALRAGVAVADLEFAQFHPTVLALPGDDPFLVSEAVRGEGAYLRAADGDRFLSALHPLGELAPRDVVARGIQRQMAIDGTDHVRLDLRHLDAAATRARFPTIARELAGRGLDLTADQIPVAPAAHYFMGGIVAGPAGETSLPGLLALGEAACTGVHGANRLASNSLLEGLVFGLAAADAEGRQRAEGGGRKAPREHLDELASAPPVAAQPLAADVLVDLRRRLRRVMSRHVAVVRDATGLADAAREIGAVGARLRRSPLPSGVDGVGAPPPPLPSNGDDGRSPTTIALWELRNMADAAEAIVAAALRREESRGAHFRSDFPVRDPTLDGRHSILVDGTWRDGTLADARRRTSGAPA